ncbi:MAG: penicillin-binding protein 2 [Eubacterium sp.]|nr:penicillin-binding protein 2 [Eubacterium sp.]
MKRKASSTTTNEKLPKRLAEFLERERSKEEYNRKINRPIVFVTYIMVLVFMAMFGFIVYYVVHDSETIISNTSNRRQDSMSEFVVRGDIVTEDGEVIATTEVDEEGNETRVYPYGSMFAHVVGYNSYGRAGLELEQNFNLLRSHVNIMSKLSNEISGKKNPGDTVVTSLRYDLQEAAINSLGGARGAVVVMEPSTGRILAMVSAPAYDPNDIDNVWEHVHSEEGEESTLLLNRATQGLYAPGSTFKIITAIEYMRENPDYEDYSYDCEGKDIFNSVGIRCSGGNAHGTVNLEQSVAYSCNTSFANLGIGLDMDKFRNLTGELLFNKKLPYQGDHSMSKFMLSKDSDPGEIPQTVFGQGDTLISPLHNCLIMSAIANGGVLMKPYMVDEIDNADGAVLKSYSPKTYGTLLPSADVKRVIPLLEAVCDYGTASSWLSGLPYRCAGKTGTAEVDDEGRMNSWFVGYAGKDIDKPEIVISVVVEDYSENGITGTSVARNVFDEFFD